MATQKTLEHYLRQMRLIEEHREKWAEQNIKRYYRELMTDLQEFLGVEYSKLAQDDKLTYEILQGKGEYARFLEEVERRINTFTPKAAKEIRDVVQLTYKAAYEGMVSAVEKSTDIESLKNNLKGLKGTKPEVIKRAVENPISGLTLNDTLEKNRKEVIYDIKQQIGIGLSQGDRMSTMSRRISEQVDMDYRKATRIVRTETHRVREMGYQDSAEEINQILKNSDSDIVMVKIWKTMKDERVRPQRKAYKRKAGVKARKKFTAGLRSSLNGPNHVKMEGQIVLVDELFDLGGGVKAIAPGQSGVAGHDINCRCYASKDIMTRAEYEKLTGKKIESKSTPEIEEPIVDVDKLREEIGDLTTQIESLKSTKSLKELKFDTSGKTAVDTGFIGDGYYKISAEDYLNDKIIKEDVDSYYRKHVARKKFSSISEGIVSELDDFFDEITKAQTADPKKLAKLKKLLKDKQDEFEKVVKKYHLTSKEAASPRTISAKILDKLQSFADSGQSKYNSTLRDVARTINKSTDEARAAVSEALGEIIDECDIGIRIKVSNLEKVLDETDGGFKNLFETGIGGGCTDFDTRGDGEKDVFGYLHAIPTKSEAEDRPIYGMMIPNLKTGQTKEAIDYIIDGPGSWYGDGVTVVVNKSKVFNNSSFTIGDSLDNDYLVYGSTFDNPQFNGASNFFKDSAKKFLDSSKTGNERLITTFNEGTDYLEVQIHGKENHSADIIEKVYFESSAFDRAKRSGLIDKLDSKKIQYEVLK